MTPGGIGHCFTRCGDGVDGDGVNGHARQAGILRGFGDRMTEVALWMLLHMT